MNKIEALCIMLHPEDPEAVTKSVTDDLECTIFLCILVNLAIHPQTVSILDPSWRPHRSKYMKRAVSAPVFYHRFFEQKVWELTIWLSSRRLHPHPSERFGYHASNRSEDDKQGDGDGEREIGNLRSEEKSGDKGTGEGRQHWPPSLEGRDDYPRWVRTT